MTSPPDPARPVTPSEREIADLTARLRALTGRRADDAERAAVLADKQALLDRLADDDIAVARDSPMTAEQAARALAARGHALDHARALVCDYLDEVSEQVGAPVHRWGLDEEDVRAIETGLARAADPEQERHEQLIAWHTDDHALPVDDLVRKR